MKKMHLSYYCLSCLLEVVLSSASVGSEFCVNAADDIRTKTKREEAVMPVAIDFDVEAFDKYLSAEVVLPKGDQCYWEKLLAAREMLMITP